MVSESSTAIRTPLTREESGTLLGNTMGFVALTAGFFALGAYLGRDLAYGWGLGCFLVSLALLVALHVAASRSMELAITLLFAFGVVTGVAIAPSLAHYASADPRSLWLSGAATALFVAGIGTAGYATRRDLSALGRSLFWALLALIGFGVVTILVEIPNGTLIYAIAGLVIFAGLTAYDFQRLRQAEDIRAAPLLAASIFLDILNVFLLFLSLFGREG